MKILLTGIAGRVGRFVARELVERGHSVLGIDVRPLPLEDRHESIDLRYADIGDPLTMLSIMEGCDAVIHTAAYPTAHGRTSADVFRNNAQGTQNILDAAVAQDVKRVVITSSIGALGFSFPKHPCVLDYFPVDANYPRRPQDIYGLTKLINEESAAAATRLNGISTIILRPPAVMDLEFAAKQGWLGRMSQRNSERRENDLWAYIDSRDLAVFYCRSVESELTGHQVFFTMADDLLNQLTVRELIEKFFPDRVADIEKLTGNTFYDLRPAEEAFGYKPIHLWKNYI